MAKHSEETGEVYRTHPGKKGFIGAGVRGAGRSLGEGVVGGAAGAAVGFGVEHAFHVKHVGALTAGAGELTGAIHGGYKSWQNTTKSYQRGAAQENRRMSGTAIQHKSQQHWNK